MKLYMPYQYRVKESFPQFAILFSLWYNSNMRLTLHFDGSAWPNPGGIARYGYTLRGMAAFPGSRSVDCAKNGFAGEGPNVSNNFAEFFAMAEGLEQALAIAHFGDTIEVLGDSDIAIRLMQGIYKASKEKLYWPQYNRCVRALKCLHKLGIDVEFKWIPREKNQECDDLSKLPATKPVAEDLLAEAEGLLL